MQFLLFIILPLALSKDAKQKLCSTSNCRKCDSYLSVANPHINSIPKTSKLFSFDYSIFMIRDVKGDPNFSTSKNHTIFKSGKGVEKMVCFLRWRKRDVPSPGMLLLKIDVIFYSKFLNRGEVSRWSSTSQYSPTRNSVEMTTGKTHPT